MRKSIWDKRIPTLFGIFLIVLGVAVTTFMVQKGLLFQINAGPTEQPQSVRITNVTDTSFTVSYFTNSKVIGSVNYGKTAALGQSGLDDRDQQSGSLASYNYHNITVRGLTSKTKYFFTIISGQNTYLNNSEPFEVTTGQTIASSPTSQGPITGKIILPSGNAPNEAILYLTTGNSQVISTMTKSDGSYIIPLNSLRTSDISSYYNFSPDTTLQLLVVGDTLESNVQLSISQINPVPTITLSQDFDFRVSSTPVASASANLESFPSFESTSSASTTSDNPSILTPQKDQGFSDQQPVFKGKAPPGESVQITIHSDTPVQTEVTSDSNGNWNYRPTTPLTPGTHTITIVTKDAAGIVKTITQSFVVYASGTQIAGANGSPTPTPISTETPTPTPAESPTSTPTVISETLTLTPTPTATVIADLSQTPTLTETPTPTVVLTPTGTLPATGNPSIITAGIVGLVISLIGGLLFLLSRGGNAVL